MLNEALKKEIRKYLEEYYVSEESYSIDAAEAMSEQRLLMISGVAEKTSRKASRKKRDSAPAFSDERCFPEEEIHPMILQSKAYEEISAEESNSGKTLFLHDSAAVYSTKKSARRLEDLVGELEETFSERLFRLIREKGLDETEVYKKAFLDRRHFSKIRNDRNYAANKKTVLALSVAMKLNLDEARDLLNCAGFALSRSSRYDMILQYFLENQIYDLFVINDVLYEYGEPVFE